MVCPYAMMVCPYAMMVCPYAMMVCPYAMMVCPYANLFKNSSGRRMSENVRAVSCSWVLLNVNLTTFLFTGSGPMRLTGC